MTDPANDLSQSTTSIPATHSDIRELKGDGSKKPPRGMAKSVYVVALALVGFGLGLGVGYKLGFKTALSLRPCSLAECQKLTMNGCPEVCPPGGFGECIAGCSGC